MHDVIIVGGGPAGITAGIYAARKKINTLIVSRDFNGQMGKAFIIENYPGFKKISGAKLIERFKSHLEKFDIDINDGEEVVKIKKKSNGLFELNTNQKDKYETRAVIIASGRDPRPLEVPGEKEFLGKGVSYCTTCDAPIFRDKTVAVIGGGNSGFEAAIDLAKYANKIYLLEFGGKILADEFNQERVKKIGKIDVITNAKVKSFSGSRFLETLIYEDMAEKKEKEIAAQGVFIQIGSVPATGFARGLVEFNKRDEIKISGADCSTKTAGVFAAGDVTDIPYKQMIIAAGEGAKAALSAYYYIQTLNN